MPEEPEKANSKRPWTRPTPEVRDRRRAKRKRERQRRVSAKRPEIVHPAKEG